MVFGDEVCGVQRRNGTFAAICLGMSMFQSLGRVRVLVFVFVGLTHNCNQRYRQGCFTNFFKIRQARD